MNTTLDDGTIAEFHAQGVTVIRGAFGDWVETLRAGTRFHDFFILQSGIVRPVHDRKGRLELGVCGCN